MSHTQLINHGCCISNTSKGMLKFPNRNIPHTHTHTHCHFFCWLLRKEGVFKTGQPAPFSVTAITLEGKCPWSPTHVEAWLDATACQTVGWISTMILLTQRLQQIHKFQELQLPRLQKSPRFPSKSIWVTNSSPFIGQRNTYSAFQYGRHQRIPVKKYR